MKPTIAKYTCSRIDDMVRDKLVELKKEYSIPSKSISDEERFNLIVNGDVDFSPEFIDRGRCRSGAYISDVFDFSEYESYNQTREGYGEACKEVVSRAQAVKDEIWLGDEEDARRLLKEFEEY